MDKICIKPARLSGNINAPASKSHAHRLLIAAALSDRPCLIANAGSSDDIAATIDALRSLGAVIEDYEGLIRIEPIDRTLIAGEPSINCRESGSTLRFLVPVAAALYERAEFYGSGRLGERPMEALLRAMEKNGTRTDSEHVPFRTEGKLKSGIYELPGNISSQYVSGLIFALPLLEGDSEIVLTTELSSYGYAELTIDTVEQFGIEIIKKQRGYLIPGGQTYRASENAISDGDWSGAAFYLAEGAIGGPVGIGGLDMSSLQKDREILEIIRAFGGIVDEEDGTVTVREGERKAFTYCMDDIPDIVPAAAVLAAMADGESVLKNCGRLRIKESDRLAVITDILSRFGIECSIKGDDLHIVGGRPEGARLETGNDHRMVMMAVILALHAEGNSTVYQYNSVKKSYPDFFEDLKRLGGEIYVI